MNIDQIIFDYKMNYDESLAFRLSYLFYSNIKKLIPDYKIRFNINNDPRKTILFKYCYKLIQETKDLLNPEDYEIYIKSQILVIKHVLEENNKPVFIEPYCLVGEKAWKRYLFFKKHYEYKLALKTASESGINIHKKDYIISELFRTKKFLESKLGTLTKDNLASVFNNRTILRWYAVGLVSGYYLAISSLNCYDDQFDLLLYTDGVTADIKEKFKELFSYEVI